jgi:hypothetical protein
MSADRYLKIVLTIIALELGWLAVKDSAVQVSAQQVQQPTPVIIRGVEIGPTNEMTLPVTLMRTNAPIRVTAAQPIPIEAPAPIRVQEAQPIVVETRARPLLIQSVPAVPAPRPGPGE